jgi:hypothetical protein
LTCLSESFYGSTHTVKTEDLFRPTLRVNFSPINWSNFAFLCNKSVRKLPMSWKLLKSGQFFPKIIKMEEFFQQLGRKNPFLEEFISKTESFIFPSM